MSHGLRRVARVAVVLAGVGLASWLVFGPPQGWDENMTLVRIALGLASVGVISGGARLVFPDSADLSSGQSSR